MDNPTFSDNTEAHRFEARIGDALAARAEYNVLKGALLFTHTEVESAYEGQGVGSKLARFALDDVRRRGLHAVPVCKFIAAYIQRHPEYLDLVTEEHRLAFLHS